MLPSYDHKLNEQLSFVSSMRELISRSIVVPGNIDFIKLIKIARINNLGEIRSYKNFQTGLRAAEEICLSRKNGKPWIEAGSICLRYLQLCLNCIERELRKESIPTQEYKLLSKMENKFKLNSHKVPRIIIDLRNKNGSITKAQVNDFSRYVLGICHLIQNESDQAKGIKYIETLHKSLKRYEELSEEGNEFVSSRLLRYIKDITQCLKNERKYTPSNIANSLKKVIHVYSPELKSKINNRIKIVRYSYDLITDELLLEIENLNKKFAINLTKNKPQSGIARFVDMEEMKQWRESKDFQLFVIYNSGQFSGYYAVYNSISAAPPTEHDFVQHVKIKRVLPSRSKAALLHMVIISKKTRFLAKMRGYKLYKHFTESVKDYLVGNLGAEQVLGKCRGGNNANISLISHLKVGWQIIGYFIEKRTPFHIIQLPLHTGEFHLPS